MRRTYRLGFGAVLVAALLWSAAWSLGPSRLREGDLQNIWGGDPNPIINNQCIGTDTCTCKAAPCSIYIIPFTNQSGCIWTTVSKQTFANCLTNPQSQGKYCYTSYPQPPTYCGTTYTNKLRPDGTCAWPAPSKNCGGNPPTAGSCGQSVPSGFGLGQTCK